jgi:hypothetical protein
MRYKHKRLTALRSHVTWLPKELITHLIEYSRSWEGILKKRINVKTKLKLSIAIEQNKILVYNLETNKLAIYNLTTQTFQDLTIGYNPHQLNANEFIFMGEYTNVLHIVKLHETISMRTFTIKNVLTMNVVEGKDCDTKIVLLYGESNDGIYIFDPKKGIQVCLPCKFAGPVIYSLREAHFAVLPTILQSQARHGIQIFKIEDDLSNFQHVLTLSIPRTIHWNYQLIYHKGLFSLIAIDSFGTICIWDLRDLTKPHHAIWFLLLSNRGAAISHERSSESTFVVEGMSAKILHDGRLLLKLLVSKPRSSKSRVALAAIDLFSRKVTVTRMSNFDSMTVLPDDRIVIQTGTTFIILE